MAKCRASTWPGVSWWPLPNGEGTRTAHGAIVSPPVCPRRHSEGPYVALTPRRPGPAGALVTTTTPRHQTLLAPPWGANPGTGAAPGGRAEQGSDTGICTYPQVFQAAGKCALSPFPSALHGDGPGPGPGRSLRGGAWPAGGGVVSFGAWLRCGSIKAPPRCCCCRRSLRLVPVCVCVSRLPAAIPAAPQPWRR